MRASGGVWAQGRAGAGPGASGRGVGGGGGGRTGGGGGGGWPAGVEWGGAARRVEVLGEWRGGRVGGGGGGGGGGERGRGGLGIWGGRRRRERSWGGRCDCRYRGQDARKMAEGVRFVAWRRGARSWRSAGGGRGNRNGRRIQRG